MAKSLAELIAELPEDQQQEALEGIDPDALVWDWSFWGRPEQHFPDDDSWDVGLFLAGRGAGKTRACAEWIREKAMISGRGTIRFLLVARTTQDVRQTMLDGDSGLLHICPPSEMPVFKSHLGELHWPNGNIAVLRTADEPDGIRGTQAHFAWGDEIAAWRVRPDGAGLTGWDNLVFATRLGTHQGINPQIVSSTTPKRVPLLFDLLQKYQNPDKADQRVWITRGSTYDNAGNLAKSTLNALTGTYGGTTVGRQELMGEMLDEIDGALWTDEQLGDLQDVMPNSLPLRIVGVDPSVAENPGDECGIVVVGSTAERDLYRRRAWVLEDASVQGSPEVWAKRVVEVARKYNAPVVAEVNQGGALVRNVINNIDPSIRVLEVHARNGKLLRAEPIALAYEQERVKHVASRSLVDLQTQMTTWMPGETRKSPDRIDALVHGLTALLITPPKGMAGGKLSAQSMADRKLETTRPGPRKGSRTLPYLKIK